MEHEFVHARGWTSRRAFEYRFIPMQVVGPTSCGHLRIIIMPESMLPRLARLPGHYYHEIRPITLGPASLKIASRSLITNRFAVSPASTALREQTALV